MKKRLLLIVIVCACFAAACAQDQEPPRRNLPPGEMLAGKVTAVSKDSLTLAPLAGGEPVTVKVSESTRIMKERQPVKLEEIKPGDTVVARGKLNGSVMDAGMVGVLNPEMVQRFQQGGGGAGAGGGMIAGFNREDWGKKFIFGEVRAINETKLTIARPDGPTLDIEVDENTSFKKGAESITLPDIKVGDFVRGRGQVKNNVFVPTELIVGGMQVRRMVGEGPQPTEQQKKPEEKAPPK